MIQLNESYKSKNSPLNFQCQDCYLPSFQCEDCYQLSFQCEHCDQVFNLHSVNIAIFLHGVFFLEGKDHGYIGFNCPKCQNTLLLKGEINSINQLIPPILKGIYLKFKPTCNQLRYFPSVNYSPKKMPGLGAFDIMTNTVATSKLDLQDIRNSIAQYTEEMPQLVTDYLCSYSSNETLPMGFMFSVSWFKENQIERLADFENRKQFKVFPRYFYKNDLLDQVDKFCWHNHLYSKFLSDGKKYAEENLKGIADIAEVEGLDMDNIMGSNPGIGPKGWEYMQKNMNDDFDWNLTGKFMEILVADPDPLPNPGKPNQLLKGLWKSRLPFKNETVPNDLKKINAAKFDRGGNDQRHQKMVDELQANSHLKAVQTFLKDSSQQFIEDYIDRAQDITFAYADLWEIKERYLIQLFKKAKAKAHQETDVQYSFHEDEDVYEIFFEGKRRLLDKTVGIKRLQYLIIHKYDKVSIFDMDDNEGISPERIQKNTEEIIGFLFEQEKWAKKRGPAGRNIEQEQVEKKWGKKVFKEMRSQIQKWKTLNEDASVAEEKHDHEKLREIRNELKRLTKIITMIVFKSSLSEEEKKYAKNLKHKIDKSINEVIGRITDRRLREHFKESYKPVPKQYALSYSPHDDIDWKTD